MLLQLVILENVVNSKLWGKDLIFVQFLTMMNVLDHLKGFLGIMGAFA